MTPDELTQERFRELVRLALEPVRAEEAALRDELLDARLDAMPEGERPTDDERADLDSRLAGAMAEERVVEVERGEHPLVHVRRLDGRGARELLEKLWPRIAGEWQAHRAPVVAARLTLDDERARDDRDGRRARDPEAVARLATAVRAPLDELLTATGDGDDATARAVDWLKSWGVNNADAMKGKRRLADLVDRPLMLARVIAGRLWPDVRERLVEEGTPAVIQPFVTGVLKAARHAQRTLPLEGKSEWEISNGKGKDRVVVARLVPPVINGKVLWCNQEALRSLPMHMLLRWLVATGHRQRFVDHEPLFDRIEVEGGWTEVARRLGKTSKRAAEKIHDAAHALTQLRLPENTTWTGQMFSVYEDKTATGRHRRRMTLSLFGPLRPGYVFDQLKDHRTASDKWLVPVPVPERLPAMIGREADYGSQAGLQMLTMREFRTKAEDLCTDDAVTIDAAEWRRLAEEAELPRKMMTEVLDAWVSGQGRTPGERFLVRRGTDRFDLAEPFERERNHIVSAGEAQLRGRKDRQAFKRRQARVAKPK